MTERTLAGHDCLSTLKQTLTRPRIVLWCRRARCMPHYEFLCYTCNRPFSKTRTPAEYKESKVVCPRCGSVEVEQRWFYFVTTKQSA